MSRRSSLVVLLVVIALVGGWRLWDKRDVLQSGAASLQQLFPGGNKQAAADAGGAQAGASGSEVDEDNTFFPQAKPAPVFANASAEEMFPFAPDTPLLTTVVPVPDKRPPLVYVAPGLNSSDILTSPAVAFAEFYKLQLRAQRGSKTLLNPIPNSMILRQFTRAFSQVDLSMPPEKYISDARLQGADIIVMPHLDEGTSMPRIRVSMLDLRSSRTQEWTAEAAGALTVQDAIVKASVATMQFAGIPQHEIDASGVTEGAPGDQTFARLQWVNPNEYTWEIVQAALRDDPGCRALYSYDCGTTTRLQLVNLGLKQFPDDPRLQISKAFSLADNGSTTALMRYTSELMRRYPDNFFIYAQLPNRLNTIYIPSDPAGAKPPELVAMIRQMDEFVTLYPDSCDLRWDQAYMHKTLATWARGGRTINRIPSAEMRVYREEGRIAYKLMRELAQKHPDYVALQNAYTYYMTSGGGASTKELRRHSQHIASLDPRATEAELETAFWNSIGYGRSIDYIRLIDEALRNHAGDPDAIAEITKAVGQELWRQVGWKEMTEQQAYGTTNPYLARFLSGAQYVYGHGKNLRDTYDRLYYHIAEVQGDQKLIEQWHQTGQNTFAAMREARAAMASGSWERAFTMASLALPGLDGGDEEHLCRYWIIKSLWKMKRYDESLKAAREGIWKFPREQTFPYMYAIVGLEYGKDLETAFDCAWRAVDLGTGNQGCNDTFEKLRAKLNKPQHPALAGLVR